MRRERERNQNKKGVEKIGEEGRVVRGIENEKIKTFLLATSRSSGSPGLANSSTRLPAGEQPGTDTRGDTL